MVVMSCIVGVGPVAEILRILSNVKSLTTNTTNNYPHLPHTTFACNCVQYDWEDGDAFVPNRPSYVFDNDVAGITPDCDITAYSSE